MVDRVEYLSGYSGTEIDDAVGKRHAHGDLSAINKLSQDITGEPTWDGDVWPVTPLSHGVSVLPTISYTSPNITVTGGEYCAYNTPDFSGRLYYISTISSATFEITDDNIVYHLYVINSNGIGTFGITTDVNTLYDGRYVSIARIIRTDSFFHTFFYDTLSLGFNSKIQTVMEHIFGFQKMSGLGITVAGTRNLIVDAGQVAYGAVINNTTSVNSATGDNLIFVYKDDLGHWQTTPITQLNNTQYQTPNGLANLTSINQAVNWIWRGVEEQKHVYILLGEDNYNESEALNSSPPIPPTWLSDHSVLLGRVLFARNSDTPSHVETIETVSFTHSGAISHDDVSDKSGVGPEYYHLSNMQYQGLVGGLDTSLHRHANATNLADGFLAKEDKDRVDNIESLSVGAIKNDISWKAAEWDNAFSWGDHAAQGYLTSVSWGQVSGTLSNQTDLQNALDNKVDKIEGKGLIEEAPMDGNAYIRVNGAWERLTWGSA